MNIPGRVGGRAGVALAGVLACAVPAARAQSANCEAFKDRVAASIDAKGVQGYALEIVPSRAPRPAGARAVGTCDGGAYTVLYRRWAGAAGEAPAPAASAPESSAASAASAPAPRTRAERRKAERAMAASAAAAAAASAAASVATAKPQPAAPAVPSPSPAVATQAAAIAPLPDPRPVAPPPVERTASSNLDDTLRPVVWVVVVLLAAAALVRAFRRWRHDRYYDEAGLPRGPRL